MKTPIFLVAVVTLVTMVSGRSLELGDAVAASGLEPLTPECIVHFGSCSSITQASLGTVSIFHLLRK